MGRAQRPLRVASAAMVCAAFGSAVALAGTASATIVVPNTVRQGCTSNDSTFAPGDPDSIVMRASMSNCNTSFATALGVVLEFNGVVQTGQGIGQIGCFGPSCGPVSKQTADLVPGTWTVIANGHHANGAVDSPAVTFIIP